MKRDFHLKIDWGHGRGLSLGWHTKYCCGTLTTDAENPRGIYRCSCRKRPTKPSRYYYKVKP